MLGLILLVVATVLKVAFAPIMYIYGIARSLFNRHFNKWNRDLAISKDQYGNALGKYLFNDLLITKNSVHFFGNIDETISSVIGKNNRDGALSIVGRFVDKILNAIDKNHSIKSIDETENDSQS